MKTFTRVFMNALTEVAVRVQVEDDGETIRYTMPDGEVHTCKQRDEKGIAECPVVNERAAVALA